MKAVFLESNIDILFQSESHIEHTHHLRLCTLIFEVQCIHHPLVAAIIFFILYDAFSCFQQFKALLENQNGHRIKILRTDRGSEYILNEFLFFCKTHGIQKKFTAWYTPQ